MSEAEVYIASERALTNVIKQIKDDQWNLELPEWFELGSSQDRAELDLKQIINYHAYDTAWIPETLAGATIAEVGSKYDGDLLGSDPAASYERYAEAAIKAAETADLDKLVHLTYGDFPTREYLKHITSFRGFRAFSIAKLIGVSTKLPDDLVQGMYDMIAPEVEDWRKMGVFGPPVEVPADADLQTKLLGMCGRKP